MPVVIFVNSTFLVAQDDSIYRLPAGTLISLKMDLELSSKVASVGDTFTAKVAKPLVNRDVTVLAVGTIVDGRVTSVSHAGPGGSGGKLEIVFDTLRISSVMMRPIEATMVNKLESRSPQTVNVLSVIGGTVIGAVFGAVTKSTNGALIGAGVGGGAGTAVAMLRKGKDVRIRKGEEFEIVLNKEVVLPVLDY